MLLWWTKIQKIMRCTELWDWARAVQRYHRLAVLVAQAATGAARTATFSTATTHAHTIACVVYAVHQTRADFQELSVSVSGGAHNGVAR